MEHLAPNIFIFSFLQQQIRSDCFKHISESGGMVIDPRHPVINLRKRKSFDGLISNIMVGDLDILLESNPEVWTLTQRCLISLKEHRKGVFSKSCVAIGVHLHQFMLLSPVRDQADLVLMGCDRSDFVSVYKRSDTVNDTVKNNSWIKRSLKWPNDAIALNVVFLMYSPGMWRD